MRMISLSVGALTLVLITTMQAYPQMPSRSPKPSSDRTTPPSSTSTKRSSCQSSTQELAGEDKRKQVQLCMARIRVDCLKQAVNKKLLGPQRRYFVDNCMSE